MGLQARAQGLFAGENARGRVRRRAPVITKGADKKEVHMPIDPVCKMEVSKEEAVDTSEYRGITYYFCSEEDKEEFDANPEKYVKVRKAG